MSEFTGRNLANTLWAFAKMGHHPGEELLLTLAPQIRMQLSSCNAQNLANILWAFATLGTFQVARNQ